jgi:hypothetical protein
MRLNVLLWLAATVCLFGGFTQAAAQDDLTSRKPSLQFELRNQETTRTGGPIPLTFDLVWNGAGVTLIEGRLQFVLTDGVETYGRFVSHDLAVNPGRNSYQILMPSLGGRTAFQTVDLVARFETVDGDEIDLEARPLRVSADASRFLRVLYCDPVSSTDDRKVSEFLKTLRFERFWNAGVRPSGETGRSDETAITVFDALRPSEMPQDPHWFCTASIVALSRNGFAELRPKQLEVLLQWVRAGGSLCVEPLGGMDDEHLEFLNGLADGSSSVEIVTDERGNLILPDDRAFDSLSCGLGNALILYSGFRDELDISTAEWKAAVAGLWSFRADQQKAIASTGKFAWLSSEELYPENWGRQHRSGYSPYYGYNAYQRQQLAQLQGRMGVRPIQSAQGLLERLMPEDVEVVPLPYIGAILVLYLLTIGPVDYFVLGLFKARRFTWITFPVATLAFTLFTVWLSNSFLSSSAERTFVEILDVTPGGEVVRSNRLELLFTMSSNNVTTELKSGIFTALDHSRFGGTVHDQYNRAVHRRTVPPPTIVGRPPFTFAAIQAVPKWTPQINRVLEIAPEREDLPQNLADFDWQREWDLRSKQGRGALRESIRSVFGNDAIAVLFNGRQAHDLLGQRTGVFQESALAAASEMNATNRNGNQWLYTDFLWDSSARLQGFGLFGVVSRVSPHGGANFEDLTVLDPSDPNQWLLVIVRPDGENMTIYRRLYQLPPDAANAPADTREAATDSATDGRSNEASDD